MPRSGDAVRVDFGSGRCYDMRFAPLAALDALLTDAGLKRGRCVVVTDGNVSGRWLGPAIGALGDWDPVIIVLPAGEETKSAAALHKIYDAVLPAGIDRQTPVIALGGGVVGDLAGFAAATLLRGLPLVHVPTSLIAQVDSAIGGKVGINHAVGKNLIGTFCQPRLVCVDTAVLQTLPALEWNSGLAEVVKHALIADPAFMAFLDVAWEHILARDAPTIRRMVHWAASIKAAVVGQDEREQGRRAILNFGHTFGHAIERVAGYGAYTHGEAVALGMRAALTLSSRLHPDYCTRQVMALVKRIPVRFSLSSQGICVDALMDAMRYDKKVQRGVMRFVVLCGDGQAYVTDQVSRDDLSAAWAAAFR